VDHHTGAGSWSRAGRHHDPIGVDLPATGGHLVPYDVTADPELGELQPADDVLLVTAEVGDGLEMDLGGGGDHGPTLPESAG
jgi:hypothetical protein